MLRSCDSKFTKFCNIASDTLVACDTLASTSANCISIALEWPSISKNRWLWLISHGRMNETTILWWSPAYLLIHSQSWSKGVFGTFINHRPGMVGKAWEVPLQSSTAWIGIGWEQSGPEPLLSYLLIKTLCLMVTTTTPLPCVSGKPMLLPFLFKAPSLWQWGGDIFHLFTILRGPVKNVSLSPSLSLSLST